MTISMEYLSSGTPEYSYDMTEAEVARLAEELLRDREPITDDRLVTYEISGKELTANLGRQGERVVFEKFFNNDAARMNREYGEYEENSMFYVTVDRVERKPATVVRVGEADVRGEKSFKSINDVVGLESYPYTQSEIFAYYGIDDPTECWDILTAAALPGYGGGEAIAQTYRAMYVASQRRGIKHFFSIIDEKPFELMGLVGFPFQKLYGADWMEYIDSAKSLPVYGDAPTFEDSVRRKQEETRQNAPDLYPFLESSFEILGQGKLDHALMLR